MIGVHDMEASLDSWRRYLQGICALTPSHVSSRTDLLARYVAPERIASGGRHVPMAVFTYFDIERKAWRSFNVSRLEGIEDSYSI